MFCFQRLQVVRTGFRRKSVPPFSINHRLSTDDIPDKNHHIEWLDLDSSRVCYFSPQNFTIKDKNTALILPEIPSQATQRYPRSTKNRLEVIDLEYKVETEFMKKDTRMESVNPMDDDRCDCQVSITEGVNLLSFNQHNNIDEEELTNDQFSKSALITKWRGSTGTVNNNRDQLTIIETTTNDLRYETITNQVRADTQASRDKGKFSLPPLKNNDGRRHTVHVPSITVCQDGEIRVGKDAEDSIFDPRFLMPTEVSWY